MIFLIGMPAVGKTWWGQRVAKAAGWQFIDLDQYIELREGRTVQAIFERSGQQYFREVEHTCLTEILQQTNADAIVACGGGTPVFNNNIQLMKEAGTVVYLQSPVSYLLTHLHEADAQRPLLKGKDIGAFLSELLAEREPVYNQAHYILQAKDISLTTFDKIIASCTDRH